MIKNNIRLVISIAKKYQGVGMNLQDLVQEGCRGIVRGAEKFDASKGFKLSTYAHWWIKQSMTAMARTESSLQRVTIWVGFFCVYFREDGVTVVDDCVRPIDVQVTMDLGLEREVVIRGVFW
ncbi:RNA polymerase sigma factor sigB-like [Olea europaea subsp. europaea]|uniref:RNA polymerase sigma factor sigB-like n=1 Tax=Olea europaea subsp. europaea TaxID=158383 RepID=A0A8S0QJB4_OLEEU|nr:RNA polymerase sigma factor sigB-like [Olea europaea subsp. europaea]